MSDDEEHLPIGSAVAIILPFLTLVRLATETVESGTDSWQKDPVQMGGAISRR
jgi:hypothetical protein